MVLLDNDGGGIFNFLPVAREGDDFEEHVATPHGLDFAHAAALYGCGFEDATSPEGSVPRWTGRSRRPHDDPAVRTEREANLALHRGGSSVGARERRSRPATAEHADSLGRGLSAPGASA